MLKLQIRKLVIQLEETCLEMGREVSPPSRKVTVAAVITNPYAGRYVEDLSPLYALGAELGGVLAKRGVAALGVAPDDVQSYGKGAIVGTAGELEHAAALIHPTFGAPVRAAIGGGAALIPSTKVIASAGFRLTIPITNRHDIWSFDEMDSASISIDDAPHPDEIVIVLAFATGGRPAHRTVKRA